MESAIPCDEKQCKACAVVRPVTDFRPSTSGRRRGVCWPCERDQQRRRLAANRIRAGSDGLARVCQSCGMSFSVRSASEAGRFCSKECLSNQNRREPHRASPSRRYTAVERACVSCGMAFQAVKADVKRGAGKFCSRSCYYKHNETARLGWKHPQEVKDRLSELKRGKPVPFDNPNPPKPSISFTCEGCGEASLLPGRVTARAPQRRFCSNRCKFMHNKSSSHEASTAAWLSAWGVEFEAQANIGHWHVDVFIPSRNLVIEVNGCYWHGCEPCGFGASEPARRRRANDGRRAQWLARHGYRHLEVWEHSFKGGEAEQIVRQAVGVV